MFVIIGIVVVFGAVVGGYLMEHGNIRVLLQPAELLIIGGAGVGTVLVANPLHVRKKIAGGLVGAFGGSKFTKQRYLESLKTMYDLFNKARREGLIALESDVEEPDKSPIFSKNPFFLKDHHVRDFVCDTMRMAVTGGIEPFDVDQMMEVDMDVHHHGETVPISALSTMADSLPGLGIVAAVLGVVITMGALGGPPEEIGHRANAARRLMQDNGMAPGQVVQIRGYADQHLRKKDSPEDPSNRRITVIVQYTPKSGEDAGAESTKGSEPPKDAEAPKGGEVTPAEH